MENSLRDRINQFFEEYPSCAQAYRNLGLFHVTHSSIADKITTEGLMQQPSTISAPAASFLEEMFFKYGTGHPSDREYLNSFILGKSQGGSDHESRGQFLSAHKPFILINSEGQAMGYVIPERIIFLLRGLNQVATLDYISTEDQQQAQALFDEISKPFFAIDSTTSVLKIDPTDEAVLESMFANFKFDLSAEQLESFESIGIVGIEEFFEHWLKNLKDVVVLGEIRPDSISISAQHPIDTGGLARQCTTSGPLFSSQNPKSRFQH